MLGLKEAGKTTIVYKFKSGLVKNSEPTTGFKVETFEYCNFEFNVWDLDGQEEARVFWREYFPGTDVLIFVVNSKDKAQIELAKQELHQMLDVVELKDAVLLVLANKQDLSTAMSIAEVTERLGLAGIKGRDWLCTDTCALSGMGFDEGLNWVNEKLGPRKKELPAPAPQETQEPTS